MPTMYGIKSCIDTVDALKAFSDAKVDIEYRDFNDNIVYLKEFLKIRDKETVIFEEVKAQGGIGIPCYVLSDGTITLDTEEALRRSK